MSILIPNALFLTQIKLRKRIRKLEAQLKAATRILRYYANMSIWNYRGVKFDNKENPDLLHTFHTSFESNPIKDGWEWARDALEEVRLIGLRRTNGRNRKAAKNHK